jgi:hypothetical protein
MPDRKHAARDSFETSAEASATPSVPPGPRHPLAVRDAAEHGGVPGETVAVEVIDVASGALSEVEDDVAAVARTTPRSFSQRCSVAGMKRPTVVHKPITPSGKLRP